MQKHCIEHCSPHRLSAVFVDEAGTVFCTYTVVLVCVFPSTSVAGIFVRVGDYSVTDDSDGQQEILIEKIITHESYFVDSEGLLHNDIALLQLQAPITSKHAGPVCLPNPGKMSTCF